MFSEYEAGRTPNPDVLCNREIKFDVFLKAALELGADYVATGHYCQKRENEDGSFSLLAGKDPSKDQSYFLCQICQNQLVQALFPIGKYLKSEVREIAEQIGLVTAQKKDSQGLCFVGKISLPTFLQQQLKTKKGKIIEIPTSNEQINRYHNLIPSFDNINELITPFEFKETDGIQVAEHQGAHFYTIGQRKGLHVGGRPEPSFVVQTDVLNNLIFTGQTDEHKALNRWALFIKKEDIHFISKSHRLVTNVPLALKLRIRYRQPLQDAQLLLKEAGLYILFNQLQRGITPGQFAAWYSDDELIGSGVISN